MMNEISQQNHLIALDSPLGKDAFLLTVFRGEEELSSLFSYELEMFSSQTNISPQHMLGKKVSFCVRDREGHTRYFNGFISKFYKSRMQLRDGRQYRAEVVPWLWFLTRSANYQIFQNKTVIQIIEEVFKDFGFSDYKISDLKSQYAERAYCVQYGETAFNFISRLMEEEGIFYFFVHEKDKHILILADHKRAFIDFTTQEVIYRQTTSPNIYLQKWDRRYLFTSGKYSQSDYNFVTANTDLFTTINTVLPENEFQDYEIYEFPGKYERLSGGKELAKLRIEEQETTYDEVSGEGRNSFFSPGVKFHLKEHVSSEEQGDYLITSVTHQAFAHAHISGYKDVEKYSNTFKCIPQSASLRPSRMTLKPRVNGLQMAIVVGLSGARFIDPGARQLN